MTDRIAEIEARLDRKREPCQDIYFDSWNWDQKKFHLHAEEDVAYLLAEVRRLRDENEELRKEVGPSLVRAFKAEALALELADMAGKMRIKMLLMMDYVATRANDGSQFAEELWGQSSQTILTVNVMLDDERLTKMREKKCQV